MASKMVNNVIDHLKMVVEMQKARALHLDWFGGEPMICFDEIIDPIATFANEIIEEYNIDFSQHITTNATLMDKDRIQAMKNLHFTSFQIPIDGNEQRRNKIRFFADKKDTYKIVMNNINLIADIIPKAHIVLRINFDKQTLKQIGDVIKDISEESKKQIEIDFQKVWQIPFAENEEELLKQAKDIFVANGLKSEFWACRPRMFYRFNADRLHHSINYDGRVFKCTASDYGDDKVIGNLVSGGNIEWNQELQSNYFSASTFETSRYLACNMLSLCMGPCFQKKYDSRKESKPLPCNFENAEYSLTSYIVGEPRKRNLKS